MFTQLSLILLGAASPSDSSSHVNTGPCGAPYAHWRTAGENWPNRIANRVIVGPRDQLTWNGKPSTADEVGQYLRVAPIVDPAAPLVLTVQAGADCAMVRFVRREIDVALNCEETNICGEESGDQEATEL